MIPFPLELFEGPLRSFSWRIGFLVAIASSAENQRKNRFAGLPTCCAFFGAFPMSGFRFPSLLFTLLLAFPAAAHGVRPDDAEGVKKWQAKAARFFSRHLE